MIKSKKITAFVGIFSVLLFDAMPLVSAVNITGTQQYAEDSWNDTLDGAPLDGSSNAVGLTVTDTQITGKAWMGNFGWLEFQPDNGGVTVTVQDEGAGNVGRLGGEAWGKHLGWVGFDPWDGDDAGTEVDADTGVYIDGEGYFQGVAWSEKFGAIAFGDYVLLNTSTTTYTDAAGDKTNFWLRTDWRPTPPNVAPTATSVTITGTVEVGSTLTGNYTYTDDNSDAEGTSTYQWYQADTAGGTYSAIGGATNTTFIPTQNEIGKYLKFEVTPVAATGETPGIAVLSPASTQITTPYTVAIWPSVLQPEGNITAYAKVWNDGTPISPDDIVIELRAAIGSTLIATKSLSGATVTAGTYNTRLDGTYGTANYRTIITRNQSQAQDVFLKIMVYDTNDNLLISTTHNDFTESPAINPVVTVDAVTTPTATNTQVITGTITEVNLEANPASVKVNGNNVSQLNAQGGGNWTYSYTMNLSEGANGITVIATDMSGNTGQDTDNITLDTTAPTAGTLSDPTDGNPPVGGSTAGWSRSGEVDLTWTAATDVTTSIEHYEVWRQATSQGASGHTQAWTKVSGDLSNVTLTWTDTGRQTDTLYTYKIRAYDQTGNYAETGTKTIEVDTEVPGATITTPTDTQVISTGTVNISVDFANTNLVNCQVRQDSGTWHDMDGDNLVSGTATYTFTGVADGTYDYNVQCTDEANNTGTDTSTSVIVDTTDPTGSIIINAGATETNNNAVTLTLTYADTNGSGVSECRYKNETGGTWSAYEACTASKLWTLATGLGTKTVYYEVKDSAGNTMEYSDSINIISAQDNTSNPETVLPLETSPGTASVGTNVTNIVMRTDQKLDMSAGTQTQTATTQKNGITIQEALNQKKKNGFSDSNIKQVQIQSGIEASDITITSDEGYEMVIPDGASVYSDTGWDGNLAPLKDVTSTTTIPGYTPSLVIQGGSVGRTLLFDNPIKLTFPNITSGTMLWSEDSTTFNEITTQCSNVDGGAALTYPNECYFRSGLDTIIWTYHLTEYGVGVQTASATTEATVTIEPGVRVIWIADALGNVIESPTVALPPMTSGFQNNIAEATLGTPDQQILLYNPTDASTWSVTLSATAGPTAQWTESVNGYTMDFNDATGGGQLTLDPTAGVISLAQINPADGSITGLSQTGGDIEGLSLGNTASFDQGSSDSLTLVTSTSADPYRIYSLQDLKLKQLVPAMQPAGNYQLDITITSS